MSLAHTTRQSGNCSKSTREGVSSGVHSSTGNSRLWLVQCLISGKDFAEAKRKSVDDFYNNVAIINEEAIYAARHWCFPRDYVSLVTIVYPSDSIAQNITRMILYAKDANQSIFVTKCCGPITLCMRKEKILEATPKSLKEGGARRGVSWRRQLAQTIRCFIGVIFPLQEESLGE